MTDSSPLLPHLDPIFPLDLALLADGARRVALILSPTSAEHARASGQGWSIGLLVGSERVDAARCDEAVAAGADVTVFVGTESDVELACALERVARRNVDLARLTAVAELRRLLGFPACCIEAHLRAEDWSDEATVARLLSPGPHEGLPPTNNLFVLEHRLISHFPCTLDCAASADLGQRALHLIDQADPSRGQALRTLLTAPIHVWDRRRFLIDHPEAGRITANRLTRAPVVTADPGYQQFTAALPTVPAGGWQLAFNGAPPRNM